SSGCGLRRPIARAIWSGMARPFRTPRAARTASCGPIAPERRREPTQDQRGTPVAPSGATGGTDRTGPALDAALVYADVPEGAGLAGGGFCCRRSVGAD